MGPAYTRFFTCKSRNCHEPTYFRHVLSQEYKKNLDTYNQSLVDMQSKKDDLEQCRKENLKLQNNMKNTIGLRS